MLFYSGSGGSVPGGNAAGTGDHKYISYGSQFAGAPRHHKGNTAVRRRLVQGLHGHADSSDDRPRRETTV